VSVVKGSNLAVRFLLELTALAALGYAGWSLDTSTPFRLLATVGVPLVAAIGWGAFVAPKATHRLPDPARLAVEAGVFGAAVAGLVVTGRPVWACALAALVVVNEVLLFVWDQRAF